MGDQGKHLPPHLIDQRIGSKRPLLHRTGLAQHVVTQGHEFHGLIHLEKHPVGIASTSLSRHHQLSKPLMRASMAPASV